MKDFRIVVFAAFAVLYSAGTLAQVNDPIVRTGGGHGSVAITSPIFRIVSPSGTSPVLPDVSGSTDCVLQQPFKAATTVPGCLFQNKIMTPRGIGLTITRLTFIIDNSEFSGPLNCGTDTQLFGMGPFAMCGIQTSPDGTFSFITFFRGSVPYLGDFSMGMRGFNLNSGFPGVALLSTGTSAAAQYYELPYVARLTPASHRSVNGASQSRACEGCRQTVSYFDRDRLALASASIAADAGLLVQRSVWNSPNRPNLDGMPRYQTTIAGRSTSGCLSRVT
jgi:hypothetical protein